MSAKAITKRLQQTSELRQLCLTLAAGRPAETPPEEVPRTKPLDPAATSH